MTAREIHRTLPGTDYRDAAVFEAERDRLFHGGWFMVGRAEPLSEPGACRVVDVAGESILLVRSRDDGELRGFFNVCRHRGAQLCDAGETRLKGAIRCPYHAWSFAHDGSLLGTPHIAPEELDRDALALWPVAVEIWEGTVFVSLADDPRPLADVLADQGDWGPLPFARFRLGELRTGRTTVSEVAANWKIIIENYNECLHCPTVHPELVRVVPLYRTGSVVDPARPDGGVALAEGGDSFTLTGRSRLPLLPGVAPDERGAYYGCIVFPNGFIDVTGTSAILTTLLPRSASHTTVLTEYLFPADAVDEDGFDPSEVVDFCELVARQDYDVCERVQRGVSSRAFTEGVLVEKDDLLHGFNEFYLAARGPVD